MMVGLPDWLFLIFILTFLVQGCVFLYGTFQRLYNSTLTIHLKFDMALMASSDFGAVPNYMTQYHWVIEDRECGGVFPDKLSDIFDIPSDGQDIPSTFRIPRNMNERFIVKRKWKTFLSSTGVDYGSKHTYKAPSTPNYKKAMNLNIEDINVITLWKDTGGGKFEDVKSGAILYVVVNDNTDNTNMYATLFGPCRAYFY